ncbi:MAG: DUF4136 domain-containing protein [Cyclobacteriaceae bacterium]
MKTKLMIVVAASFLLFEVNCSNQISVRSDYDRDVNLVIYKTYAWLPEKEIESKNNPLLYNELTDKRIRKAVELQFQAKGIPFDEENPDFRVHYHIIVENRSSVSPAPYGYYYSPYWTRSQMYVYQYQEGTLIIDLMDAKNNKLIWRGWATEVLNNRNLQLTEKEITEAVYEILKEFPPKRR